MKKIKIFLWLVVSILLLILVFRNGIKDRVIPYLHEERSEILYSLEFSIDDYFKEGLVMEALVDRWYQSLTLEQRLAQLVMPAYESSTSRAKLLNWINGDYIGGFMILRSDLKPRDVAEIVEENKMNVPLLISVDAEPSLFANRFPNLQSVAETSSLKTPEAIVENAELIAFVLRKYGINLNFAPVYDVSNNQEVIGNRSFGSTEKEVSSRANLFAQVMKDSGIIATAKHFPGHGNVSGDTHNSLLMIEGDLTEIGAFKSAIQTRIPIMMVGHLAVSGSADYQTDGLPATLSEKIMKKLLREDLGFKGVVITDAMNMGAVNFIADKDLKSLRAGADIVLMPNNPVQLQKSLLRAVREDPEFAVEVEKKVKRVLRLKLAWRLAQQSDRSQKKEEKDSNLK